MNWIGLELTFSKSTHKVVNERVKDSTRTQQQSEDVALMELMYRVFTRRPGGSYCRRLRSLLYLPEVF